MMNTLQELKITMIGAQSSGKTSLCQALIKNHFSVSYNPTLEEFYRQQISINGVNMILEIIEMNELSQNFEQAIESSESFMFIYDITNKLSYERMISLHRIVTEAKKSPFISKILIGNKNDDFLNREVTFELGLRTASQWGCKFFELSAKNKADVEFVFGECIKGFLKEPTKVKKCCCYIF